MSGEIVHVTDASFREEVLMRDEPTLILFWAEWNGPSKQMTPLLEDIARHYDGRVRVAKINNDENQESALKYQVRNLPLLILFKNGAVEYTKVGAETKQKILGVIDPHL